MMSEAIAEAEDKAGTQIITQWISETEQKDTINPRE